MSHKIICSSLLATPSAPVYISSELFLCVLYIDRRGGYVAVSGLKKGLRLFMATVTPLDKREEASKSKEVCFSEEKKSYRGTPQCEERLIITFYG